MSLHPKKTGSEITIGGNTLLLWTYGQLERQSQSTIKSRATLVRDIVGADRLDPFSASGGAEAMIAWLLNAQCQIAASEGFQLTAADFGAPAEMRYTPRQVYDPIGQGGAYAMQMPYGTSADDHGARRPMAPTAGDQLNRGQAALMLKGIQAKATASVQAQMAKERNMRGNNIFG